MLCDHSVSVRDTWRDDYGGPLFMQDDDRPPKDVLVGVVSWGASCGSSKYPGVYARVSSAYQWFNRITCTYMSPESYDENGRIRVYKSVEVTLVPTQQPSYEPSIHYSPPHDNDAIRDA